MSGQEGFLSLPLELKRRVATFLESRDAIQMALSCQQLHRNLSITHLEPVRNLFSTFRRSGAVDTGDRWTRALRIPVLNRRVHSMRLECFWRDQGWGTRKGNVCIVGFPTSQVGEIPRHFDPGNNEFEGGRVVARPPGLAQHHEERLRLRFSPVEGEVYYLWFKAGAGGGHVLHLRDGVLHTVIFDDEFRNFSRNYRILFEEGVLCREVEAQENRRRATTDTHTQLFFPRMLISVSRSLRRQLQDDMERNAAPRLVPEDELEAFLSEYSIPLNMGSLVALEEIVQADIEERVIRRNEQEQIAQQADDNDDNADGEDHFPFEGPFILQPARFAQPNNVNPPIVIDLANDSDSEEEQEEESDNDEGDDREEDGDASDDETADEDEEANQRAEEAMDEDEENESNDSGE